MKKQNRAGKDNKSRASAREQASGQRAPVLCREIKVLSVREEPGAFNRRVKLHGSGKVLHAWNSLVAASSWYRPDQEQLVAFCLDTQYWLKSFSLVSLGSVNESLAHPREVFRPAIADAAFAVIVAHNHPSGDPSPSDTDNYLCNRLYRAGDLLQIRLLDFVIVGDSRYFSMAETAEWPPSKFLDHEQRDLSDCYYSRNLSSPGRIATIHATDKQRRAMVDRSTTGGRLLAFLAHASRRQLTRMRDLTPLFFDGAEPPGYYVCARNFRPTDTLDWELAKSYRSLIRTHLK
jgi:RadC-like JAB domain